jgi:WD40 repeat protein
MPGGRLVSELSAWLVSNAPVCAVAFSTDSQHLAAAVGDRIAIWNTSTGDLEHTLARPKGPLTALALCSNATAVAATTANGTVWFRKLQRAAAQSAAGRPTAPDWLRALLRQVVYVTSCLGNVSYQ